MLLEPSSQAPVDCDDEPSPPEPRRRPRSRKPPLTRAEAARADARTMDILERHGIDFRPAQETALVVLATGAVHLLDETRSRPLFAAQLRRRAAEMALTFDAFRQDRDLGNLRLVGLRPRQGKAPPGTLAQALKTLARDYDRHVGRLVTAGIVAPVLSVIHLRYDVAQGLWDIHVHALWDVADDKIDAMWIGLGTKFSDKWMDGSRVEFPGAAANYSASWGIDHRQIMAWPEEALLEVWRLPRVRLLRPAGALRKFRGTLKNKVVNRHGDRVLVEERLDPGPRRKAVKRPAPAVESGRVVAVGLKKVAGEKALCAVVKAQRGTLRRAKPSTGDPTSPRARVDLAYGEYRRNSPTARLSLPRVSASPHPFAPSAQPGLPRKALNTLFLRKAWMLAAWPPILPRRLPRPIIRRLAKPTMEPLMVAPPFRPSIAKLPTVRFRRHLRRQHQASSVAYVAERPADPDVPGCQPLSPRCRFSLIHVGGETRVLDPVAAADYREFEQASTGKTVPYQTTVTRASPTVVSAAALESVLGDGGRAAGLVGPVRIEVGRHCYKRVLHRRAIGDRQKPLLVGPEGGSSNVR